MKRKWLRKYGFWIIAGAFIVTIGFLISATRENDLSKIILSVFDDWSVALSAGAAVILAFAAFRAIKISSEQKQLLTDQTAFLNDQIKYLRQERLIRILDDICVWTTDMTKIRLDSAPGRAKVGSNKKRLSTHLAVIWLYDLSERRMNGESLRRQSENIWPEVSKGIDKITGQISDLIGLILDEYKHPEQYKEVLAKLGPVMTSAEELLVIVDKIKSSILSQ